MSSLLGSVFRVLQQLLCILPSDVQGGQNAEAHERPQHRPSYGTVTHPPQLGVAPTGHSRPPRVKVTPVGHSRPPSSPPIRASEHEPPSDRPYRNGNLINQDNEHFKQLRTRANEEGDAMARCFKESKSAYEAHNGALAKELSNKGRAHQKQMNNLNAQASDWIFKANNTDSNPGEIDLHGLYVNEAIIHSERAIQEAQSRGDSEIRLIVGKGLHSPDHVAKLEPAIKQLVQRYNLSAHLDDHNAGVLVVALNGRRTQSGLDDITNLGMARL
ncbi:hypothetical protein JB92DRAFT_2998371 [Gautieria morchelliformis]|nr:hypothetical protein JB92DRAFT_2998371 [Gautieria morchelliformis]